VQPHREYGPLKKIAAVLGSLRLLGDMTTPVRYKTSLNGSKRHAFYHHWAVSTPLCSISAGFKAMHDEAVKQTNPDFDALLVFLANWEAIERSALGRILTAGQLADVQELERLFALPAGDLEDFPRA
jgi:hypothetical protein